MKNVKRWSLVLLSLAVLLFPTACKDSATGSIAPVTLNVSAAASLTDVLTEINKRYTEERPWVTIVPNFASSGTIQQQIENGAPCDVFISAAAAQMDNLDKKGLLWTGTRRNLLINSLVLIVPATSTLDIRSFTGLTSDKVKRIAVGDPSSVPAGTYARQAFDQLGITSQVQSKLVLGGTVRQVLTYVETGDVDAGLVFVTDALTTDKVRVIASAPQEINATIAYPVAIIASSPNPPAAGDYINYLRSPVGEGIFEKNGFLMAGES
jgi:molybdate transport system substrate-binding protein